MNVFETIYSQDIINIRRENISDLFKMKSANIKSDLIKVISHDDLKLLFQLYDDVFLNSWFRDYYKGKIKFSLSRRMTKSAGLTLCPKNIGLIDPKNLVMEIRIGIDFFFNFGVIQGSKSVCGIKAHTALEALQLVLEHEICHVLEFINYNKSNCNGERFKRLANNLFGHNESHHRLLNQKAIASQKYGFNVGDRVSFDYKNKKLTGIIYNITKRATIMVRDDNGPMVDDRGKRYSKYYVSLSHLK